MSRPRKLHLATHPVTIRLTPDELRAASPINDWSAPVSAAEQIHEAVLIGSRARAREKRIGANGFEVGMFPGGLEILVRTQDAALIQRITELCEASRV